jgi:AraC-like DNA-binding protein
MRQYDTRVALAPAGRMALLPLGGPITEHAHPQAHVVFKLDGPDATFLVDGAEYPLTSDAAVLVNPWVSHAGIAARDPSRTQILALYFDAFPSGERLVGAGASGPLAFNRPWQAIDSDLKNAVQRIRKRMLDCTLQTTEVESFFAHVDEAFRQPRTDRRPAGIMDFRVRRVLARLAQQPGAALDGEACVQMAGLSRSRFFELFRIAVGVSPRVYANALRLDHAIRDLANKNKPIKTLSEELGFSVQAHFTRFFERHVGSSPRAFRRGLLHIQ